MRGTLIKRGARKSHLFAGKDMFVTSTYRKKLEEDEKWLEEERR